MSNCDFIKDGFKLSETYHGIKDIAPISLKIAINAYFSTYSAIRYNFKPIESPSYYKNTVEDTDKLYSSTYYKFYAETITHFHHFIELMLKRILQSKHQLLLGEITDSVLLYKVLSNQVNLNDIENYNIKALSFRETLSRVCDLVKADIISKSTFDFILKSRKWLEDLNELRNRLLHRGMYILRYKSLDKLVGKYIFPFIIKIVDIYHDEIPERYWKYKKINCNIDPISEIMKAFKQNSYDMGKIALLKEMGRAAYNNNLPNEYLEKYQRNEYIKVYEKAALAFKLGINKVKKCPVCGLKTLIIYEESDGDQNNDGSYDAWWTYIWKVRCIHCSFELHNEIKNASGYGYNNIEDWF